MVLGRWTTGALVGVGASLSTYLAVITVAAMLPRSDRRRSGAARADSAGDERRRFAILVPAHDEAAVIGRTLDSFARLDYPPDRVRVYVVADNCTDDTAAIARAAGVEVLERDDLADAGKGSALNWLFDIVDAGEPPDAYVIVDADTVLEPSFLVEMDAALRAGALAAQACYTVAEPDASSSAGLRYAALACRHHLRSSGRARLGASCGLYGNGMMFPRATLQGRRWSGHLVEDAEFQMELLFDGISVTYVPGAVARAEMPDTLAASESQNQRWELGRLQLARRFVGPLARRALRTRGRQRVAAVDALFDHLVPPLSVLVAVELVGTAAAAAQVIIGGGRGDRLRLALAASSLAVLAGHVVTGLVAIDAPRSVYRSLLGAPRAVLWKIALWLGVIASPERVGWVRTARNVTSEAAA
jgi:cellulose synthase/poly-beta-1,6-N-acetylglucosamine synthase-like glycosyltransferase